MLTRWPARNDGGAACAAQPAMPVAFLRHRECCMAPKPSGRMSPPRGRGERSVAHGALIRNRAGIRIADEGILCRVR